MKSKLIKKSDGWYNLYDGEIGIGSTHAELQGHKLSKQNCDEIFGVVDVESLALSKASFFGGTYRNPEGFSDEQVGYLHGFIEAMELNKDKQFTENDVIRAIVHYTYLLYNDGKGFEEGDNNDDRIECVIASLKQKPTEIEVEIKMEPCFYDDSLGGFSTSYTEDKPKEQPKLDSDGCLILKKI
jgi:hypothetical protein